MDSSTPICETLFFLHLEQITGGERLTLTLWFSRDGSHDEDAKLISFLSEKQLPRSIHETRSFLPQPASSRMYWFPPDTASTYESGFDICFARIHAHGYDLYSLQDISCFSASDSSNDLSEVSMAPLRLAREHELFDEEFVNILHVLQVLFCKYLKFHDLYDWIMFKHVTTLPQLVHCAMKGLA